MNGVGLSNSRPSRPHLHKIEFSEQYSYAYAMRAESRVIVECSPRALLMIELEEYLTSRSSSKLPDLGDK